MPSGKSTGRKQEKIPKSCSGVLAGKWYNKGNLTAENGTSRQDPGAGGYTYEGKQHSRSGPDRAPDRRGAVRGGAVPVPDGRPACVGGRCRDGKAFRERRAPCGRGAPGGRVRADGPAARRQHPRPDLVSGFCERKPLPPARGRLALQPGPPRDVRFRL